MSTLYQSADVLVLPLFRLRRQYAVSEAIACVLPMISTDVGGNRDYLDKGFAELFPPGAVDHFFYAILHYSENETECRKNGNKARQFAEKHLSWKAIAERTLQLYNQI